MNQQSLPLGDAHDFQRDEVVVYSDGGSRGNPGPAAIGAVVYDGVLPDATRLAVVSECIGITTNNVAEYRAVIAGLEAAAPFRARSLRLRADSLLVVRQLRGEYRVRQPHLRPLYDAARALLRPYQQVELEHVRRELNVEADALVNAALDATAS
ncbi:MAG: ribonuclease HI family protein [Actinomycetota bacterium]